MNSLYLILGSETALADRALAKLNAQLIDEKCEITTLFATDTIAGDISDALAPSLFSERRALIIRDLQDLPEDNREEITRYIQAPDLNTTIIFVHKGGVKGKTLLDAIKKAKPEIIACESLKKDSEKAEFVKSLFLDLGRKASPGAVTALVGALGNDLRELQSAVSQISTDSPSGVIDEAMVDKYHQGRVETTGFDVADATLDGDLSAALTCLRSALETGTDPVMITSAIASALRSLAKVAGVNRNQKSFELAGTLGMAPWQIDKARRQLNRWSPTQIADAVIAIAQADAQVKGAASDPIYSLEKAVTRIVASQFDR